MGHRDNRTPGQWEIGTMGHLDNGTPGQWDAGTPGHQDNGTIGTMGGVEVPTYRNHVGIFTNFIENLLFIGNNDLKTSQQQE